MADEEVKEEKIDDEEPKKMANEEVVKEETIKVNIDYIVCEV